MHRFFVLPAAIASGAVTFTPAQAHQMARVLRLLPGERVLALDGQGYQHTVRLTAVTPTAAVGMVEASAAAAGEPRVHITLYQALLKGDGWDYVLQKGTEAGIARFVPVLAQRCVAHGERQGKLRRWERIVTEAAEQSGRAIVPAVAPVAPLAQALRQAPGLRVFAYERAMAPLRDALRGGVPSEVSVFVGPEGGFEPAEATEAARAGARVVGLGPRVLRAETAGPAIAFAVLYASGDFG